MDEIISEFLTESAEGLDQLDLDFVTLEQNPQDSEILDRVFRTIHTIKGTCGFLGFCTLEGVAHAGENLLAKLRVGDTVLGEASTNALLEMVDAVREQLDVISATGSDGDNDYKKLMQKLNAQATGKYSAASGVNKAAEEPGNASSNIVADKNSENIDDDSRGRLKVAPLVESSVLVVEAASSPEPVELDEEMMEVVKEFLQESNENLDRVDSELMELEENPGNVELLSSVFRSIHTIKGTCGFFAFNKLEKVTHIGESLLVKLRDGEYRMTEDIANGLLSMVDAVRAMLIEIADKGHDGSESYDELILVLSELKDKGKLHSSMSSEEGHNILSQTAENTVQINSTQVNCEKAESSATVDENPPVVRPEKKQSTPDPKPENKTSPSVVDASIRVDVPVLDALMNLVGELVLARNQIVEFVGVHENPQVVAAAQRLNLITSELQEGVMRTRMQPIHSIWAKLPRVVRDLSKACGKKIRVEMEGKTTELDKSLIEAMKDPITHLVRNSVDHGIESPEERSAAGKPEEGVLLLRAFHEGGQVHIEISDDGGGIKADRIKQKAIDNGLITLEQAGSMTDQEVCKMIFSPGLSTAEQVTNISGRGVGMDVVKTNIERISGTIDLDTEVGRGSVFKIRVPLTLAIVPALIASSGKQRFAIPQVNLIELIRINEDKRGSAVEFIHGCPVHRLRGQLLPLVYLNQELRMNDIGRGALNIVVLQAERHRFGLVVDQINDTQEIVVKPLADALKDIPVYAGATIMGDGRVALILDAMGIGQRARVLGENEDRVLAENRLENAETIVNKQTLLLIKTEGDGRVAIPLDKVARLEQFDVERIEKTGNIDVVQYRGQILPLIALTEFLHDRRDLQRDPDTVPVSVNALAFQVVVFGEEGCQVGLVVRDIVDIVDETLDVRGKASREGVLGTATIQGCVTEILDVDGFVHRTSSMVVSTVEAA